MIDIMKFKRSAALLLALCLLLLAALSGCKKDPSGETSSSSDLPEPQRELSLLLYSADGDATYWNAVVDAFKIQYPNVNVTANITQDAAAVTQQQILDGKAPDLVFLPDNDGSGVTNALIQDHALLDLTDFFASLTVPVISGEDSGSSQESQADSSGDSEEVSSKTVALWSGILENSSCQPYGDGKTYLAPVLCLAQGLWYNANALSADAFSSWENLAASSAALTYGGADPRSTAPLLIPALTS